ncbi:hypothetical protein CPU12_02975 [Malaciobacter molluscorum LMG 25693]|uniref:Uncharacterized protein n=1 Tax=Malaciobacter molluscorum LMG 25693 TaxID=870501 RepID=A0A2G1DK06_9BACT|nr:hypothetical protein [Malaciobacter molluscorum]AXX91415.1 hypothetical protein AMOL_0399 [Malaciobacter molluscorum LMG 25693]PHO18838.1 hypothetical protein CPU12_02975 [Malaciobacter molluscorum LMG 25693]RXJ94408.1 hypothetical protein CRV00_07510 [Malaciobacter molluscorum]
MKKLILTIIINLFIITSAYSHSIYTKIREARVIGIFDENGNGENVQHVRETQSDYNGTCYTKIVVFGSFYNTMPIVYIGNSKGIFQREESIHNKYKIKNGTILVYKHINVTKGYAKITINDKLYDYRVFVK